jgi:2-dehydro-3-deoxy-D-arabinonate dehydratase
VDDPHDLKMQMKIERDGERRYQSETDTSEMARSCEEIISSLSDYNTVPETTVLLTDTSLVPEEGFTLQPGDQTDIDIEKIGRL